MLSQKEYQRYARHLALKEVGEAGQLKLKSARVLLVGLGGLGCPVAQYLAAAGVGHLGLVEYDVVDFSNLQRQVLHSESSVGSSKCASAVQRLNDLNSDIEIKVHELELAEANARELVADYDIVVDGTDNFSTRYLLNDACVLERKPYVSAAIFKFEGQLSVFNYKGGPCYRCIYPTSPPAELIPNCAEGGVLGALPGVMGTLQAMETIKIILELGEVSSGYLLLYDALGLNFRRMKIKPHEECPMCSDQASIKELKSDSVSCQLTTNIKEWSVQQLNQARIAGEAPFVLDVREDHELKIAVLSDTHHIAMGDIASRYSELPTDTDIIVMCRSGKRSMKVCEQLVSMGYQRVFNLRGGILEWSEQIDPDIVKY